MHTLLVSFATTLYILLVDSASLFKSDVVTPLSNGDACQQAMRPFGVVCNGLWTPIYDEKHCVVDYKCLSKNREARRACPYLNPYVNANNHWNNDERCNSDSRDWWRVQKGCTCRFFVTEKDQHGCSKRFARLCTYRESTHESVSTAASDHKITTKILNAHKSITCPKIVTKPSRVGCTLIITIDDGTGCLHSKEICSYQMSPTDSPTDRNINRPPPPPNEINHLLNS